MLCLRFISTLLLVLATTSLALPQAKKAPHQPRFRLEAEKLFAKHDRDQDQRLSKQEFPPGLKNLFPLIDTNADGFLTLTEDIAFRSARADRRRRSSAAKRLPENYAAHYDLIYATAGKTQLHLDLFCPQASSGKHPLILWIHGGAWRSGSKDQCPALRFTQRGYVVASVNYRLSQQAIFPAQIQDCKAAVRWLRAHASRYAIDPERIGVWGSSAGGHLVAMLGTAGDVTELEGTLENRQFSSRVQAVCDFFGPTDFLQMDDHALPSAPFKHAAASSPESQLVGGPLQDNRALAAQANPITFVTADDAPFLIVHGDRDPLVPHHQSQLLFEALRKAQVPATFHTVAGAGHGFGNNPHVQKMVDRFFDEQLMRPPGES